VEPERRGADHEDGAVLDRRLYQVELVKNAPESFFATGRSKIVKA